MAANRGWVIAIDELGRARREVYERVGSCIRNGAITVPEADGIKGRLESQGQSFAVGFESFGDLL